MLDFYTAIVFITFFIIFITAADVITNRLVTKKNKWEIVLLCLFIGIAILCEWIGVKTNGADTSLIWLHRLAKLIEFCVSPVIGVFAAIAYGKTKNLKTIAIILAAHIAFEGLSLFHNWVFSIDAKNVYHRESLYWIYIVAFILSVVYCFVCIERGAKEYQARLNGVLIMILSFLAVGIGLQMLHSEIRIDFLCVAIGNMFLYNYRGNVVHQVDILTRLLNRRCYERMIENMKSPAYVLMFDINKFKSINDTYGHAAGDECLKLIASCIYEVYGKYGFCYRIGGDEFCVIMYKNLDKLKILNHCFEESFEQLAKRDGRLSGVAFGYAYYDEKKTHIQKVIEEADGMIYRNKS
ncbi:MAG: GGDEF domain-containing protein [Lachnospiraceae bacterium]